MSFQPIIPLAGVAALSKRDGRKIAILGEMRELGANEAEEHASLAGPLNEAGVDAVFLAGDKMSPLRDNLKNDENERGVHWASTAKDLVLMVNEVLKSGDVVLIKGSNASGIGLIAKELRKLNLSAQAEPVEVFNEAKGGL